MANIQEIKSRMKSINDTMKITNAMYMISSTKLRRAKQSLEEAKPYFTTLQSMIVRIVSHISEVENVFFNGHDEKAPEDKVKGLIVVTADKGLAGAYNHNVLKIAQEMIDKHKKYKLFVVGKVGRHYFRRRKIPIAEHFHYTAQNPSLHRARVISEVVMEQYKEGILDEVHIIYTSMKNSVTSEQVVMQLLPFDRGEFSGREGRNEDGSIEELAFNPSPEAVLENILPDSVMGYIYGALIESFCSEQNARMMAMEAANKNASEIIRKLSIEYNRMRQTMITQEITEVIAGAKAQKRKKKLRKADKEEH